MKLPPSRRHEPTKRVMASIESENDCHSIPAGLEPSAIAPARLGLPEWVGRLTLRGRRPSSPPSPSVSGHRSATWPSQLVRSCGGIGIGDWLRQKGDQVPHVYRVLTADGGVADAFAPAGPNVPRDALMVRELLSREGVTIDPKGRASKHQCFRASDWERVGQRRV